MEERENIINLVDEDGNDFNLEVLDIIEEGKSRYAVGIQVTEEESDEDTVLIMRIVPAENEDEDMLEPITDDEELNRIFEIFKERAADDFEFADED